MNKVQKQENGCWIWQASINREGYGTFVPDNGKKSGLAHRESLVLFRKSTLKASDYILHSCNTKPCVNPDHLKIGDAKENYQDFLKTGDTLRIKLSPKKIIKIRKLFLSSVSYRDIAKIFQVSANTIFDIIKRRTWKHV
jgi:hypothetical protein